METQLLKQMADDMSFIKKEIIMIKKHMVDADTILTEEEKKLVDKSIEHEKQGKLISHEELKRELGI